MYLKRVEIVGFKSFANRTIIDLEPKMTAIIGPNGCGKSNTLEAIRWVLGEQNPRTLRGKKMEDVIFSGTDGKTALSRAEVSITFANCEGVLPIEYNEVTITRRVYRSGESEYLLNNHTCRLREIKELFLGTGIGTNAYYVLEQGKIDWVINAKPEDRRSIFEEAAGITRFKAKKHETLNKLQHVEENLLRLRDIIREVKRQMISLQRQAGKARRYQELNDSLKKFELNLMGWEYQQINGELLKNNSSKKNILENLQSVIDGKKHFEEEIQQKDLILNELRKKLFDTEQQKKQLEWSCQKSEQDIESIQHQKAETLELIKRFDSEKQEASKKIDSLTALEHEQSVALRELENMQNNFDYLKERELEVAKYNQHLEDIEKNLKNARLEYDQIATNQVQVEKLLQSHKQALDGLTQSASSQKMLVEKLESEISELNAQRINFETRVENIQSERQKSNESLDRDNQLLNQSKTTIDQLRAELIELEKNKSEHSSRLKTLQDMQEQLEGFVDATKVVLKDFSKTMQDQKLLHGVLADHIKIKGEYELAVAMALGDQIQDVLVDDINVVENAIEFLKNGGHGSTGFIAIHNDIKDTLASAAHAEGVLGRASELVEIEEGPFSKLLQRLLERVMLVDTAKNLFNILREGRFGSFKWVSLDGVLVLPDGSIRGGGKSEPAIYLLERQSEIRKLDKLVVKTSRDIASKQSELSDKENAVKHISVQIDTCKQILSRIDIDIAETQKSINYISRDLDDKNNQKQTVLKSIEHSNQQIQTYQTLIAENESVLGQSNIKKEKCFSALEKLQAQIPDLSGKKEEALIRLTQAQVEKDNYLDRKNQATGRLNEIKSLTQEQKELIQIRENDLKNHQNKLTVMDQNTEILTHKIADETQKLSGLNEHLENLVYEEELASKNLNTFRTDMEQVVTQSDSLREQQRLSDIQEAELRTRQQNIRQQALERYQIQIDALEPILEEESDMVRQKIQEMKLHLEEMGPVNLVAINEYDDVKLRFEFLSQQETDLVNSKLSLENTISEIEQTTTQMFQQTFDSVRSNFNQIFSKIFNGGNADLILEKAEEKEEYGIDIIARPPGKKLTNLHLLSGGEKTLTAIALLMALFKVKPSPFCLLDEMDAALDDENVMRFIELIKEFSNETQFVFITHNKITMANAEVIYGVTMEEKGLSRIVSMKFKSKDSTDSELDAPSNLTESVV